MSLRSTYRLGVWGLACIGKVRMRRASVLVNLCLRWTGNESKSEKKKEY
jgi:hypothetical protein